MTPLALLHCAIDSDGSVQNKNWKSAFQIAMKKAWRVDYADISSSDGGIYIIKFRSLEWNTPQLLSWVVQQMGSVLKVKHDTSGRIRLEIDLKLHLLYTPLF